MEPQINNNVRKLETSLIRQVLMKSREIEDSINLTIGEPDITTPEIIIKKSADYMLNNQLNYAPLGGVAELREEVAKFYNTKYNSNYDADNVMVSVGSTEGLSTALKGILNPGDEVIVIKPAYPLYEALITLYGAKAVYIDTKNSSYKVEASMIEKAITPKTKAVILNYPSNPCGTLLSEDEVKKISQVISDNNVYLISDEIYSEVVFTGNKFYSPASVDNIRSKVIVINGFSKSHSMTGWRVGYIIAEKNLRDHLVKVSQYTISTPSTLSQYGAIIALRDARDVGESVKVYEKRALYIYEALTKLGFDVVKPEGTFYVLADYSKISKKESMNFVLDLLENTGVATVPGAAFGTEGCIRVSCTQKIEILADAVKRLENYILLNKNL